MAEVTVPFIRGDLMVVVMVVLAETQPAFSCNLGLRSFALINHFLISSSTSLSEATGASTFFP